MVIYLPRQMYDWYLKLRLSEEKTMYQVLKRALYLYAKNNGFEHSCRYKQISENIEGNWQFVNRCVVCDEKRK